MTSKIHYKEVTNKEEAYNRVKATITPEYIAKFQVKTEITYDDQNRKVKAKGQGFELLLCFHDHHCDVDLDLSLLLRPLKSKILSIVEEQITKKL